MENLNQNFDTSYQQKNYLRNKNNFFIWDWTVILKKQLKMFYKTLIFTKRCYICKGTRHS